MYTFPQKQTTVQLIVGSDRSLGVAALAAPAGLMVCRSNAWAASVVRSSVGNVCALQRFRSPNPLATAPSRTQHHHRFDDVAGSDEDGSSPPPLELRFAPENGEPNARVGRRLPRTTDEAARSGSANSCAAESKLVCPQSTHATSLSPGAQRVPTGLGSVYIRRRRLPAVRAFRD